MPEYFSEKSAQSIGSFKNDLNISYRITSIHNSENNSISFSNSEIQAFTLALLDHLKF